MRDWQNILDHAVIEIRHWFPIQYRNLYTRYYLYYMPTTDEHDGHFSIRSTHPPNPDCNNLATPEPLPRNMSEAQVLRWMEPHLRRLPVLARS